MKQIIKQLEEERNKLDLKIIKINQAIQTLKEVEGSKEVIYSNDPRLKRKRRTKTEMHAVRNRDQTKKKGSKKYPDEMKEFIKSRMETTSNQDLIDLINEEFDLEITMTQVKNYMKYNKLRRVNIIRTSRRKKEEIEEEKKKIGKPKKYTDEAVQFLRENVNNFSNKELCEELESRFNIKTNVPNLYVILSNKGIKRDYQSDTDPKIVEYILKSKINDVYYLRDQIIEKFEKDIPTRKLKDLMSQRKSCKESVKEEVKRIEDQRVPFDDDIDGLELDKF